ncbi:MAG TPA: universal stress protein [Ktedonobacterales bacterium]|jgi:nucleotide-binding universal stress UspA family protein
MFTHVLVGMENAAQASRVAAVVALLAKQGSAQGWAQGSAQAPLQVTLMHATSHVLGSAEVQICSDDLERLTERLCADGVEARYVLEFERPERGIVDAASQMNADLIVLIAHGRHGLDALLHPSVTAKLLAHGTAPVFIWPDRLPDTYTHDLLSFPGSLVILPLDGSELAERALPYAIGLASAYACSLALVRVIPELTPPLMTLGGGASALSNPPLTQERAEEEARAYLKKIAERHANDTFAPIETVTMLGTPALRILEFATSHPRSVIVMSTHGHGPLARATLGSVTTATAQDATTPVLVIPPHAPVPLTRTAPLMRPLAAG